ncbi:MAG: hypothetical protein KDB82_02100, partial [Planctomycetes bacterium]|nr:hypothetical protein [Planctomycetota bacterium]
VDWFMKKYLKVWQDTTQYFADQAALRPHDGMVGKVGNKFEYNREKIYDLVRADAKDRIKNFDYEEQMRKFMSRSATGINAAIGGSLIGIGGAVAVLAAGAATSLAVDITGVTAGIVLTGLSLAVLPFQRRKIKAEFSTNVTELKQALADVLENQIRKEAREAVEKIRESFGPFFDYVNRTTGSVEESIKTVKDIRESFKQLKMKFGMTLEEEKDAIQARETSKLNKAELEAKQAEEAGEQPAEKEADEKAKVQTEEPQAEPEEEKPSGEAEHAAGEEDKPAESEEADETDG